MGITCEKYIGKDRSIMDKLRNELDKEKKQQKKENAKLQKLNKNNEG